MKKILFLFLIFNSAALLSAVPPHPDLLKEYKEKYNTQQLSNKLSPMEPFSRSILQTGGFPTTGQNQKVLVLVIDYDDRKFDPSSTPTFYDGLFTNGPNGDGFGWRQYYADMSNGALTLDFDVYDVGSADNNFAYYGANNSEGWDSNAWKLVAEAIDKGDTQGIDYSDYDNDGDGFVDAIIIIHQGPGEEIGRFEGESISDWENRIWSHRSSVKYAVPDRDGVSFDAYAIQPEFVLEPGDSTIGVFVHEFGHILGLPDLYDYGGETDGIGNWGVMAGGSWGGNFGDRPAPISAWNRYKLGWLSVESVNPLLSLVYAGFSTTTILFLIGLLSLISLFQFIKTKKQRKKPHWLYYGSVLMLSCILFSTCGDKGEKVENVLADMETSYEAKRIEIGENEYILAVNKVKRTDSWTESLPGSGLLLYHIDENLLTERYWWDVNDSSYDDRKLLGVKIIEADGGNNLLTIEEDPTPWDSGSATDPFYKGNNEQLIEYVNNAGETTAFNITSISNRGSTMSFNVILF